MSVYKKLENSNFLGLLNINGTSLAFSTVPVGGVIIPKFKEYYLPPVSYLSSTS